MPYSRKNFSFADFDFVAGTASIDPSPIEMVDLSLAPLSQRSLDDDEFDNNSAMMDDLDEGPEPFDFEKDILPQIYRAPNSSRVIPSERKVSLSNLSPRSQSSTVLSTIPEENRTPDGSLSGSPILIVVSDMDSEDDDNRHWLINLPDLPLVPPFPIRPMRRSQSICTKGSTSYLRNALSDPYPSSSYLKVPKSDRSYACYSPRNRNVGPTRNAVRWEKLPNAADARRGRASPTSCPDVISDCFERLLSFVKKPNHKP